MKKLRGFRLARRKLARIFKWIIRSRRKPTPFHFLDHPTRSLNSTISKILGLACYLQRRAKTLCCPNSDPGYIQLGMAKPVEVPKGHLAVYVGESDGETRRVMVPVIYFNHPLFGQLLKEAERVHGYNHPGGITLPCRFSEFEKVKMRIAAWDHCHRRGNNSISGIGRQTMCWW